jgi:hypothetical protein
MHELSTGPRSCSATGPSLSTCPVHALLHRFHQSREMRYQLSPFSILRTFPRLTKANFSAGGTDWKAGAGVGWLSLVRTGGSPCSAMYESMS